VHTARASHTFIKQIEGRQHYMSFKHASYVANSLHTPAMCTARVWLAILKSITLNKHHCLYLLYRSAGLARTVHLHTACDHTLFTYTLSETRHHAPLHRSPTHCLRPGTIHLYIVHLNTACDHTPFIYLLSKT